MTRADLEQDGPAIRLSALVRLSGYTLTRHKLYADIERGELDATPVPCGQLHYWFVTRAEATRYLATLHRLSA
jgi:hypothetical protein